MYEENVVIRKKKDFCAGVFLFFLAAAYYYFAGTIRVFSVGSTFWVNSRTIPQAYAVLLAALSLIIICVSLGRPPAESQGCDENNITSSRHMLWLRYYPIVLTFVLMIMYVVLMGRIGFFPASAGYLFFQILVLAPRTLLSKKFAAMALVIAIGSSLFVNFLFNNYLGMHLPA